MAPEITALPPDTNCEMKWVQSSGLAEQEEPIGLMAGGWGEGGVVRR